MTSMTVEAADLGRQGDLYTHFRKRFREVRNLTERLAAPLAPEDQVVQSMPDASPAKWHRAHTSWFFETFLLVPYLAGYEVFHPRFGYLFNSYYEAVGARHPRPRRGLLTRPSCQEVADYRAHVDAAMARLIEEIDDDQWREVAPLIELGLHHEQQHQELLLTDILHLFSCNPIDPAYAPYKAAPTAPAPLDWIGYEGGVYRIGHGGEGFAWDNEGPRHEHLLRPFRLASRPVTNREWIDFIEDEGYGRAELWLSDGWAKVQEEGWEAPLYWRRRDGGWGSMTLAGFRLIDMDAPVAHASFYEADAFARWTGRRLPTEAEWEVAARGLPIAGNTLGRGYLRPVAAEGEGLAQMFGDVWEWTQSPYTAYPGYRAPAGAIGEYNGKFMCSQWVLRGGSCATPDGHLRATYRNFFYPWMRWQFSGLRLAEDVS